MIFLVIYMWTSSIIFINFEALLSADTVLPALQGIFIRTVTDKQMFPFGVGGTTFFSNNYFPLTIYKIHEKRSLTMTASSIHFLPLIQLRVTGGAGAIPAAWQHHYVIYCLFELQVYYVNFPTFWLLTLELCVSTILLWINCQLTGNRGIAVSQ